MKKKQQQQKRGDRDAASDATASAASQASRLEAFKEAKRRSVAQQRVKELEVELREKERQKKVSLRSAGGDLVSPVPCSSLRRRQASSCLGVRRLCPPSCSCSWS